jgi:hypothetical protein
MGMAHNQFDTLRIFQTGIYGAKAAFCTLNAYIWERKASFGVTKISPSVKQTLSVF